jgi:hypothetical protein
MKIKTKKIRTLQTEVLIMLRIAGGQVRHTTAIEILSRKLGQPVTIVAYLAALDSLGTEVIRVRGASAIVGIAGQPMRVAIYARVSTEDKGQDPENQFRDLRAWCANSGHELTSTA